MPGQCTSIDKGTAAALSVPLHPAPTISDRSERQRRVDIMTGSSSTTAASPAKGRASARTSPRRSPNRSPRLAAASPKPAPKLEKTASTITEDPKGFLVRSVS